MAYSCWPLVCFVWLLPLSTQVKAQKPKFVVSGTPINGPDVDLVRGSNDVIVSCVIDPVTTTVISPRMSCDDPIINEIIKHGLDGTASYKLWIGRVNADIDGRNCTCWGEYEIGRTDNSNLTFRVHTKPEKPRFAVSGNTINGSVVDLLLGSEDVAITCFLETGSPAVSSLMMSCDAPITNEMIPTNAGPSSYAIRIEQVNSDMDGRTCSCWGEHMTGQTDDSTLTFRVLIKPQKPKFMVSGKIINGSNVDLLQGSEDFPITCTINTGNPAVSSTTMSCDDPINNEITSQGAGSPTSYEIRIGQANEDIDGRKCRCSGEHVTGQTDESTLTFRILIEPQKANFAVSGNIINGSDVDLLQGSEDFWITCTINTGNPAVSSTTLSCDNPIKNEITSQGEGGPLSYTIRIGQVNADMDGRKCICWGNHVTGRTDDSPLTFRILVKPQKPKFAVSGYIINGSNVDLLLGSGDVAITCTINTGNPAVSSTTMSCDAPINNEITSQGAGSSTSYAIRIGQVNAAMDGRKCTCWGDHVTGRTDDSTLTFKVLIKPQKAKFVVSGETVTGPHAIVVQGSNDVTITCGIDTGSPAVSSTNMSCDVPITNDITLQAEVASTSYTVVIGRVNADMDGRKCTCWGEHVTGKTDDSTLTLKVLTKPNEVTCRADLYPDRLLFSCQTDKIFPQALCIFSYRNEGEASFIPMASQTHIQYSHEIYSEGNAFLYCQSNCSVTLTPDPMNVNPGDLTIQVTVNPDIEGIDQATTSDAFVTTHETVNIVAPDKPHFQRLDQTLGSSSLMQYHENDSMDLRCQVQSGNPSVYSVTLSCQFPLTDSEEDNNQHTVPGTDYVINETASRRMDGKSCTCIGNHLTGAIESSPLTFNVTYPSKVKLFNVNGQKKSLVEVEVNQMLTLSCEADGNPTPSVQIRKLETSYLDTSTWQSDQSESRVDITLVARCELNGRYRCLVGNTVNSQENTQDLDVRVRCPPTYCNETSRDIKMAVIPGTSQTVVLCVVAYPMPVLTLVKKDADSGWIRLGCLDGQIRQDTRFDFQDLVTIAFSDVQPLHLGEYSLNSTLENDSTRSWLTFLLTAPLSPCQPEDGVSHQVQLGHPITISMCAAAFPSPSNLAGQRRSAKESTWADVIDPDTTITLGIDSGILKNVTFTSTEIEATDLGQYRFYDPQIHASERSYLKLSLSECKPASIPACNCSSCLSTATIVGLNIATTVVAIILTIIAMTACRKLRKRNKNKNKPEQENGVKGHVNTTFHQPEVEQAASDSGYVEVPDDVMVGLRTLQPPSINHQSDDVEHEGEEMENAEDPRYQTIDDAEVEERRARGGDYDRILPAPPDDPNNGDLNRDAMNQNETTSQPVDKSEKVFYHIPKATESETGV